MTNKKRYISTVTWPMDPKLSSVVMQDEGTSPTKLRDTSTSRSRDKQKRYISTFTRFMNPKLSQLVTQSFRMRGRHPQNHVTLQYRGHETSRRRYISTFTRPMDPKLSWVVA